MAVGWTNIEQFCHNVKNVDEIYKLDDIIGSILLFVGRHLQSIYLSSVWGVMESGFMFYMVHQDLWICSGGCVK